MAVIEKPECDECGKSRFGIKPMELDQTVYISAKKYFQNFGKPKQDCAIPLRRRYRALCLGCGKTYEFEKME